MIHLPQELLDRVIDFLRDEVAALRASCLVHSRLINSSRRHLFASVTLQELFDLEVWADSFPSPLHSPAKHVRTLSIAGLWAQLGGDDFNPNELEDPLLEHFRSFNQVQNLILTALNLHPACFPELHFSHLQSSLITLEFYSPYPTTPKKLLQFICSFPHLENLSVNGAIRWLEESKEDYTELRTSPPMGGKLKLASFIDPVGSFLIELVNLPNGLGFRSIDLDLIRIDNYRSVENLVKSCATTLEELRLGHSFTRKGFFSSRITFLNIMLGIHPETQAFIFEDSHLLRKLTLEIAAETSFSCTWIFDLLSNATSCHLCLLEFRLAFAPRFTLSSQLKVNDWESLDAILTSIVERGFAEKVIIHVSNGSVISKEAVAMVESAFPRLKARGPVAADFESAIERQPCENSIY